jgi:hypothetical protein
MAEVTSREVSGWVGWVYFAGILLIVSGIFQMIAGFTALLNDTFYAVTQESLLVFDITAWGWIHLIIGLFLLITGTSVMSGHLWSRVVAIILAIFVIMAQFAFMPAYPLWSIIVIIMAIMVIYALTVHGSEARSVERGAVVR